LPYQSSNYFNQQNAKLKETSISTSDCIDATARNVEGKAQEALGKATSDTSAEAEGQQSKLKRALSMQRKM